MFNPFNIIVKKIFLIAFIFGSFSNTNAQNWITNFEEAQSLSTETGKNIILVFQGSDWCAPCIKLDREIWSTPEFIKYADEHLIMVKADFPRKSKNQLTDIQQTQNKELMEKYNESGFFPYVTVIDKSGTVIGNTGYKKITPTEYIKLLNSFQK